MPVTPETTAMISGHGKTRAYLHRFAIIDQPNCPCGAEQPTSEHLIYECALLRVEREELKREVVNRRGTWPTRNHELTGRHHVAFHKFIKSINFDNL